MKKIHALPFTLLLCSLHAHADRLNAADMMKVIKIPINTLACVSFQDRDYNYVEIACDGKIVFAEHKVQGGTTSIQAAVNAAMKKAGFKLITCTENSGMNFKTETRCSFESPTE